MVLNDNWWCGTNVIVYCGRLYISACIHLRYEWYGILWNVSMVCCYIATLCNYILMKNASKWPFCFCIHEIVLIYLSRNLSFMWIFLHEDRYKPQISCELLTFDNWYGIYVTIIATVHFYEKCYEYKHKEYFNHTKVRWVTLKQHEIVLNAFM